MSHATHVNGWFPAVYMSCMRQNFCLLHASNLSVRNFRIFLLMYPGSLVAVRRDSLVGDGLDAELLDPVSVVVEDGLVVDGVQRLVDESDGEHEELGVGGVRRPEQRQQTVPRRPACSRRGR